VFFSGSTTTHSSSSKAWFCESVLLHSLDMSYDMIVGNAIFVGQ
jgi:hypothetical protein